MDPLIGKTVSHYRIQEKLGRGGMGVVYRAEDIRLGRAAALKFLQPSEDSDESSRTRFLREAHWASKLDHPNICTIFEADTAEDGRMFIAMALYEGETVAQRLQLGPLEIGEAIGIVLQVLSGLAYAHEQGLVHRDIKPANLMITRRAEVKILDFGIARSTTEAGITRVGVRLGTPAYMSPEQVQGKEADHRADLWSVGVLLCEMVTGDRPFRGDTHTLVHSILNRSPELMDSLGTRELDLLQPVVTKALAKRLQQRYQTAEEMIRDLERIQRKLETRSGDADPPRRDERGPSIAVLPFLNLSSDREQDYFCAGMSEELTNALARLPGLRVASRTSAFRFKDQTVDARRIGAELNVRTLLEGSVRTSGNRLRITVQLTDVEAGYGLWSERYDREMGDVFAIQDEIAASIVDALRRTFAISLEEVTVVSWPAESLETYHAYLKGRHFWNKRTVEDLRRGIRFFREAIESDPGYAPAYAGLADSYVLLGVYGAEPATEVMPAAREAATQALQLDRNLAEAHTSLACVRSVYDWSWDAAGREFLRAIQLSPSYATAHQWYAMNYLTPLERFEEAAAELRIAQELDPLSLPVCTSLAILRFYARDYDAAIEQCRKALELDSAFPTARLFLGLSHVQRGQYGEGIAELRQAAVLQRSAEILAGLGHACALAGERDEAGKILGDLLARSRESHVSSALIAQVYAGMGEPGEALDWLERALDERAPELAWLGVRPFFDPLRGEPRFIRLIAQIGLPERAVRSDG